MKQLVYVQSWFLVIILPNIAATQPRNRFIVHPDEVLYRDEASNVVFEWDFHIGSRTKVLEFLFGEWARPGYVRKKILNVQGHNKVNKRREFERKVDWRGNIYKCVNCTAVVVMYNLTLADFKSYGINIELGVDRRPLSNWLRLVKTEPASITKWAQNIEVQEGNSTTINVEHQVSRHHPSRFKDRIKLCKLVVTQNLVCTRFKQPSLKTKENTCVWYSKEIPVSLSLVP